MLIFRDGICISSSDQNDPDKIRLDSKFILVFIISILENGKYFVFVGSDGPCKISINIGGKIFRAHHDEVNKGLIAWLIFSH